MLAIALDFVVSLLKFTKQVGTTVNTSDISLGGFQFKMPVILTEVSSGFPQSLWPNAVPPVGP
jgi:hypothetical protein